MSASVPPDSGVGLELDEAVARLTLTRPPLNILTVPMLDAMGDALSAVAARPRLRVLVIGAEGKAFSAGVAVEDHLGERAATMLAAFHRIFRLLHRLDCVTVAAVQGPALGGGAELAAFCDLVIAAAEATFGVPETRVGVFPPIAVLHFPRRVGPARALQLILSGEVLPASEAARIGLVDRVVPAAELEAAVAAAVAGFRDRSAAVLRLAKRAWRTAGDDDFEAALGRLETLYTGELMRTRDATEGLRAFLEKRAPVWEHC